MTRTLRSRLALWNLLIIACALALFAALLYGWLARTLYRHHDGDLEEEGQQLTQALSRVSDPLTTLATLDQADPAGPLLIVRNSGGDVLFRSIKLASNEPDVGAHTVLAHAATQGVTGVQFFTVRHERGPVRFVCLPLAAPSGTYLQLGRSLGDVDALLDVLIVASIGLVPFVILLTSFGGFAIARRALAPIEQIASTLESIQTTDLSRRVDPHARDSEVTRLASSINQLLDRLQTSFGTMREFTAEVSHQLQTPLTVMRGAIDMARDDEDCPTDHRQTLAELRAEVDALAATVQDLRDYALADADSGSARSGPVNVSRVFEEAADLVRALAEAHEIRCETTIAPGLMVWGNAVRLRQVLLNVGENAVQFTAPDGCIRIEAAHARDKVILRVSDTGAGISVEALPRVFDRHFRAPDLVGTSGSGLGLAIVKRIVDAHGGQVSLQSTVGAGTTVVVALPMAENERPWAGLADSGRGGVRQTR